jgi:hypothetical protein
MARLVAAMVAAMVVLTGCGDATSVPAAEGPATPGPAIVDAPFRCPPVQQGDTAIHGSDTLPRGADAALICMSDRGASWTRPPDVLTHGVNHLVDLVNSQKIARPTEDPCLGPAGLGYVIVLRYPGGTRTVSGGSDPGCSHLHVGATERVGTALVLFAYLRALVDQRLGSPVPAARTEPPLSCDQPFTVGELLAVPQRVTSAIVCQGSEAHWRLVARLDDRQTALLRDDLASSSARRTTSRHFEDKGLVSPHAGVVIARDAWGDVFRVDVSDGRYRMLPLAHDAYRFVRMLPATAALLDRILSP